MHLKTLLLLFICSTCLIINAFAQNTVDIASLKDSAIAKLDFKILSMVKHKDSVAIMVRVTDPGGNFVLGLAKSGHEKQYFTGLVDKAKKEICKGFTVTETSASKSPVPLNFSVVLDYSGSMTPYYRKMQKAADYFVSSLSNSYVSRVNFDDEIDIVNAKPTLRPKSVLWDDYSKYGGYTALFAAADAGVQTLKDVTGPRFVVVFTDGYDNSSFGFPDYASTWYDLTLKARDADVAIYAVGFGLGGYPILKNICSNTRGKYYDEDNIDSLINTFGRLSANSFDHFYLIQASCSEKPEGIVFKPGPKVAPVVIPIPPPPAPAPPSPFDSVLVANLLFELGKADINLKDKNKLEKIAESIGMLLKNNPNMRFEIHGHASPDGNAAENELLAADRAEAVYTEIKALIRKKYPKDPDVIRRAVNQIKTRSFGPDNWLYPSSSHQNFENRRVQIFKFFK